MTEADWQGWRTAELAPYVDHALDTLGPGRLMFGSDWPVCLLAASYATVLATARELTAGLTDAERRAVFGENARAAYRL